MQSTVGKLQNAVETLTARSGAHDQLLNQLHRQMYAAILLVTVFGAAVIYVLDKIWDAAKVAVDLLGKVPR